MVSGYFIDRDGKIQTLMDLGRNGGGKPTRLRKLFSSFHAPNSQVHLLF
jgi:ABC-type Na+ transport system ATPase subunit NatA